MTRDFNAFLAEKAKIDEGIGSFISGMMGGKPKDPQVEWWDMLVKHVGDEQEAKQIFADIQKKYPNRPDMWRWAIHRFVQDGDVPQGNVARDPRAELHYKAKHTSGPDIMGEPKNPRGW